MATYSIDPVAGSNANPGTEALPFRDFSPLNSGGSVGTYSTHQVQVRRGTELVVNSTTRANVVAAGGCLLTAYGDAAAPLPIISGGGTAFNPVWLQSGAGITVERLHIRQSAGTGLQCSPTTGNTLDTIVLQDILVTETVQNNTLFGHDGVSIGQFAALDPGLVSNVIARRITGRDNGGHGMKARGLARNVQMLDSTFLRSGLRTPAHGSGTCGEHMEMNRTTSGVTDIRTGWTNISGNVWEHAIEATGRITSVTTLYGVFIVAPGPTFYALPMSATPATPGAFEAGIGAANTVRINLNGVVAPTALTLAFVIYARPENVILRNVVGAYTADVNPTGTPIEGQGIYFDIGSERCYSIDCAGIDNAGDGAFFNITRGCGHYRFNASGNGKACVGINGSVNTNVHGGTFVANGTRGLVYAAGSTGSRARMNQIVNATTGIDVSGGSDVAEDENLFIACSTRLSGVGSPGARSSDLAVMSAIRSNRRAMWARAAIAAAELVR